MKRIWICTLILLAMAGAAVVNAVHLREITDEMADLLEQAQVCAETQDLSSARTLTGRAEALWQQQSRYLYVILRHTEVDEVGAGLREVAQLLRWEEMPEYTAENAELIEQIRRLAEMETLTVDNIL